MKNFKLFEVAVIVVTLFLIGSTSFFWYEHFQKSTKGKWEKEVRVKWENDVTKRINERDQWKKQVTEILNENIKSGRITGVKK